MKLYATDRGLAREPRDAADSAELEILELPYRELGAAFDDGVDIARIRAAGVVGRVERAATKIHAPVARPPKILCIGVNYASHIEELRQVVPDFATPERPIFFLVPGSAVIGPYDPIVLPRRWPDQVDYESELAIVIGRRGKDIAEQDVWSHVAGLTMANDVSARDIQLDAMMGGREFSLTHAKGLDGFKPMGPCLVTLDELGQPPEIEIACRVNGELRQQASSRDLVHSIPACVSYVSRFMRLDPGDVLLTGSPAGVGIFRGGEFLRAGDVVEVTGEGIGTMRNQVVAEATS